MYSPPYVYNVSVTMNMNQIEIHEQTWYNNAANVHHDRDQQATKTTSLQMQHSHPKLRKITIVAMAWWRCIRFCTRCTAGVVVVVMGAIIVMKTNVNHHHNQRIKNSRQTKDQGEFGSTFRQILGILSTSKHVKQTKQSALLLCEWRKEVKEEVNLLLRILFRWRPRWETWPCKQRCQSLSRQFQLLL